MFGRVWRRSLLPAVHLLVTSFLHKRILGNSSILSIYQGIFYISHVNVRFYHPYFISLHQNPLLMEIIERPAYLSHIISHLGKGMMIILVGQRRVGKSYMLKQLQSWLQANRSAANVIYVNKELHAFKDIATADDLYGYATAHLPEGGDNWRMSSTSTWPRKGSRSLWAFSGTGKWTSWLCAASAGSTCRPFTCSVRKRPWRGSSETCGPYATITRSMSSRWIRSAAAFRNIRASFISTCVSSL